MTIREPHPQLRVSHDGTISRRFMQWIRDLLEGVQQRMTVTETKTAAYTAIPWEIVLCDPTDAGFTVTLPDPAAHPNKEIGVKNITASVNVITIQATSGTVEGAANTTITTGYESIILIADKTREDWVIL